MRKPHVPGSYSRADMDTVGLRIHSISYGAVEDLHATAWQQFCSPDGREAGRSPGNQIDRDILEALEAIAVQRIHCHPHVHRTDPGNRFQPDSSLFSLLLLAFEGPLFVGKIRSCYRQSLACYLV